jgi:hypothetical protein
MIRNVKLEDIQELAPIYKELYDDVDIGEFWTIEKAEKLLRYFMIDKKIYSLLLKKTEKQLVQ